MITDIIRSCLPRLETDFLQEIEQYSSFKSFSAEQYIVKQGQYIRFLPIVFSGHVKIFSQENATDFLLYYIDSGEPCIFSFAHLFNEGPIEFSATAEVDSELLLLPIDQVRMWIGKYPSFTQLILSSYQKHYTDLLNTTKQITCYNLEQRLHTYLKTRVDVENSALLKVTHQEIANDLGTSREVISRIMKKMSLDQKVIQVGRKIKVL